MSMSVRVSMLTAYRRCVLGFVSCRLFGPAEAAISWYRFPVLSETSKSIDSMKPVARPWLLGRGLELYPFARTRGKWCMQLFAAAPAASFLPFATYGRSAVSKQFGTFVRALCPRYLPSANLQRSGGLFPLGMGCAETICSSWRRWAPRI